VDFGCSPKIVPERIIARISSGLRKSGISSYQQLNPTCKAAQPKSIGSIFEAYHDRTRMQ